MSDSGVIVVGGGWAGLAAAIELARQGYAPTLLESAKQLGGRARKVAFNGMSVDNGQHLFLGAYHSLLRLLEVLQVPEQQAFQRQRLHLVVDDLHGPSLELKAPALPAPLHLMWALLRARGLTPAARWRALGFGLRLLTRKRGGADQDVLSLLQAAGQPESLIRQFWAPLCIAIMNTPVAESSAELFIQVLHDAFLHRRRDSDLLYARQDLGDLFTAPAMRYIEQHGGHVLLGQRVIRLLSQAERINGVVTNQGHYTAQHVVLAVPPHALAPLCDPHPALAPLARQCRGFNYEPICTVYLQYPPEARLPQPMQGLLGGLGQWVFDRRLYQQPGLMAVVISSQGEHLQLDNAELVERIAAELAQRFAHWPAHEQGFVIREKRATFTSSVDINRLRPDNRAALPGLWLAGDFTRTGYPATLEGAVRSGLRCAEQIHHSFNL